MMMMMIITWGQELHACLLRPRSTLVARKIRFSICRPAATPYTQPDSHTCALTRTHAHTDTYTPLVNRPCPMAWAVCQLTRVPGRAPYADTYTCPRRSSFTPLRQLCCVFCWWPPPLPLLPSPPTPLSLRPTAPTSTFAGGAAMPFAFRSP